MGLSKKLTKKLIKSIKQENNELCGKIQRLNQFMNTPGFEAGPQSHKDLLEVQLIAMATYSNTLKARVNDLKDKR